MVRRSPIQLALGLVLVAACSDSGGAGDPLPSTDAAVDAEALLDLGSVDASLPDASVVEPDASVVELDAAVVELDAAVVELDASVVELDAAVVEPDAAVVELDAAVVEPDAAPLGPCGAEECENYSRAVNTSTGPGVITRGICRLDESDEHEFVFPMAGAPADGGTLRFQWLVASGGDVYVYTRVGRWVGSSPHNIGHAETSVDCSFVSTTFEITQAQLAESLDEGGNLVLKYRIFGNAPPGAGCAFTSDPCTYNARLTYPLLSEP